MALPYVLNPGNLEKFLKEIQSASVPGKLDINYLKSRGYTGKNDTYLIAFMKNLGFIDRSGVPKERWYDHRHAGESDKVRGIATREAYKGFFEVFDDAQQRPESDFSNWARVEDPKVSPTTIKRAWTTFRTMVKVSKFDGAVVGVAQEQGGGEAIGDEDEGDSSVREAPALKRQVQFGGMGAITINIELQLPATADANFFEQFFSSMRKHLIDDNG